LLKFKDLMKNFREKQGPKYQSFPLTAVTQTQTIWELPDEKPQPPANGNKNKCHSVPLQSPVGGI
jgi:hypothetical protein